MKVLIWLAGLAAVVFLVGALLPRRVKVVRSALVASGPDALYPLLASFRRGWTRWSPFGPRKDPSVQVVFSGSDHGVGAIQQWTSRQLGTGQMKLVSSDPERGVAYELLIGGKINSRGQIDLSREPTGTRVTWSGTIDLGPNPLMRYLGPMIRSGMSQAFDEGLSSLGREVEKPRETA